MNSIGLDQDPTCCSCHEAGEMTCSEVHILRKNFWPDVSVALTTKLHAAPVRLACLPAL